MIPLLLQTLEGMGKKKNQMVFVIMVSYLEK